MLKLIFRLYDHFKLFSITALDAWLTQEADLFY